MSSDKEKNSRMRLEGRKCPSCQALIKIYALCGLYIPIENKGLFYSKKFSKNTNASFMRIGCASLSEVYSIYFMSQCSCGFTSMWEFTKEELDYLLSQDNEYSLGWVYSPNDWKEFLSNADNDQIKEDISNTLNMILKYYPDQQKNEDSKDKE